MKILIDRKYKKATYTIGNLYIDGEWFCSTLEDRDRGLNQTQSVYHIKAIKVPSETAIPIGTYKVAMDIVSPKYSQNSWYYSLCRGKVPRVLNVPGFEGILIHVGNTAIDTAGCILVGRNTQVGKLTSSRDTFAKLYKILKKAYDSGDEIILTIK